VDRRVNHFISFLSQIGIEREDSQDVRLQKNLLLVSAFMMSTLGYLWGGLYFMFDEPMAGSIPLTYAVLSYISIGYFVLTRRYKFFRFSQLALTLMLPFLLMFALGGFVNGSGVVLWSLTAPIGALLFANPSQSRHWFLVYAGLLFLSGLLESTARQTNNLPIQIIRIFFVLNTGGVSLLVYFMMHYFVNQKNLALDLLDQERVKSEKLLLNVLPEEIVSVMKDGETTIAERCDSVSVLFADMVGSTPLAARMSPEEFVDLLNEIFSTFDALVAKYGVEKIRTIGDNYMVAAGVPSPRPDHARVLVNLALDMLDCLQQVDAPVKFRIGINSGSVVAGVIGQEKFHYDLYGDAVNIASRMESHGKAGKVQITQDTYELVKDAFHCQPHGMLDVKGKGRMQTWFVVGRMGNVQT